PSGLNVTSAESCTARARSSLPVRASQIFTPVPFHVPVASQRPSGLSATRSSPRCPWILTLQPRLDRSSITTWPSSPSMTITVHVPPGTGRSQEVVLRMKGDAPGAPGRFTGGDDPAAGGRERDFPGPERGPIATRSQESAVSTEMEMTSLGQRGPDQLLARVHIPEPQR